MSVIIGTRDGLFAFKHADRATLEYLSPEAIAEILRMIARGEGYKLLEGLAKCHAYEDKANALNDLIQLQYQHEQQQRRIQQFINTCLDRFDAVWDEVFNPEPIDLRTPEEVRIEDLEAEVRDLERRIDRLTNDWR
jgi:hypothetical protein